MSAFQEQFDTDRKMARDARRIFSVLAKETASVPWKIKGEQFQDLAEAFAMVRSLRAARCAIHIESGGKGLLYWSSDAPTVLNSHLIVMVTDKSA